MKLADFLRQARMTETAFGLRLGVTQATVKRWVRNERFPSPVTIERVATETRNQVAAADWHAQAAEARRAKGNAA